MKDWETRDIFGIVARSGLKVYVGDGLLSMQHMIIYEQTHAAPRSGSCNTPMVLDMSNESMTRKDGTDSPCSETILLCDIAEEFSISSFVFFW